MPKVHMVASESPLKFIENGMETALCGKCVPDARPIFKMDLFRGEMESVSTIAFCTVCLSLALTPVHGKKYIYGIAEAQVALDANED